MPAAVPLISAAVGAIGGWGVVAGIASFVASTVLQRRAAAKARRRARRAAKDAAGIQARFTPSGEPVDIWYGRVGGYGITVYAAPSASAAGYANEKGEDIRNVSRSQSPQQDGYRGLTNPGISADNVETDYKQFLLTQTVLCVGEINNILRFVINDVSAPGGQLDGTYIIEFSALRGPNGEDNFGTASEMAKRWRPSGPTGGDDPFPLRTDADRFTDLTYITSIFFQGETTGDKQPQYGGGIPQIFAVAEGRLVRDIVKEPGAEAALSAARVFSNNVALVLLDYLTSELPYGPRLPIEKIDLESFYRFKQKCGEAMWGPDAPADDTQLEAAAVREAGFDPSNIKTLQDYYRLQGFARGFNGVDWNNLPFYQGRGAAASRTPQAQKLNVTYGEYNGVVPTLRDFEVAIDIILSVVPGAFLSLSLDGKYKIAFGDHEVTGERGSVREIEESETLDGINELTQTFDERVNQVKINFANQEKDFAADTVTFPRFGTTLHRRWLAEDGGRQLRDEDTLDGVSSTPQAQAVARMQASLSRRSVFEFTLSKKHLDLEVGDIVTLNVFGRGQVHARLEVVVPNEHLMVSCVAREYVRHDFRWWIDDSREIPGLLADRDQARSPGFQGQWVPGKYYVRGDTAIKQVSLVSFGIASQVASFWRCLRAHYSSQDNEPGTAGGASFWTQDAAIDSRRFDFIGDRIADVTFVKDQEIETFELPQASRFGPDRDNPDAEALLYAVDRLPEGLVFNPATRTITGTPMKLGAFFRVVYSAHLESTGERAERDFHIAVRAKGSPNIPDFELTAVDVERGVVTFDWQVLENSDSIVNWKFKVASVEGVSRWDETLAGNARRRVLAAEEDVDDWPVGLYTVRLAAEMQDGVTTEFDSITFFYFGQLSFLPPAPTLEITDIAANELTASWDAPEVGDNERISKYEIRYRVGYNSYLFNAMDRRSPGDVEPNEYAFIENASVSAVSDANLTFTHIKDTTVWIRIGEQQFPIRRSDADQDQQATLTRTSFLGTELQPGDFIGAKINQNWVQWVYNGYVDDTTSPRQGLRINLRGTGTVGTDFKATVQASHVDPDNQAVALTDTLYLQGIGQWKTAVAITETGSPAVAPDPEYVFSATGTPPTRLQDGVWYDVQYRYEVTTSSTNDQGATVETKVDSQWSEVATVYMTDEVAKPPPPRNLRFEQTTKLTAAFDTHIRTSFDVVRYQIQWKSGDDAYPSSPQIEITYDEDRETYSETIESDPVEGSRYAMQARSVAQEEDSSATGGSRFVFSDWTDEVSVNFGESPDKLTGFVLQTGDAEGEVKWSFPAPANMSAYDVQYRRVGDASWIQLATVQTLMLTSGGAPPDRLFDVTSAFNENDTVSGKIPVREGDPKLVPGAQYEATARYETFVNDTR